MTTERHSRQTFLGECSEEVIREARVAVVGLGGGGSHVVTQLAHIGFRNLVIVDADIVEPSNLNRLVGATLDDAAARRPKVEVAERTIRGLVHDPELRAERATWQDVAERLCNVDVLVGCVDTLLARSDLEKHCRRYLIPYIDIGMDIRTIPPDPPQIDGQVALSMPGRPCFRCLGLLRDEDLNAEAGRYGDGGPRPQVVWSNGVLASVAVGHVVDLLTGWSRRAPTLVLQYNGNTGAAGEDPRLRYLKGGCSHFPLTEAGPLT